MNHKRYGNSAFEELLFLDFLSKVKHLFLTFNNFLLNLRNNGDDNNINGDQKITQ